MASRVATLVKFEMMGSIHLGTKMGSGSMDCPKGCNHEVVLFEPMMPRGLIVAVPKDCIVERHYFHIDDESADDGDNARFQLLMAEVYGPPASVDPSIN